jgi:hypothetical protein
MFNHLYLKINAILTILIGLVFLYSFIFPFLGFFQVHAIPDSNLSSTGLSRAFAEIVRFNFDKAMALNPFSLHVFGFFVFQFFLRIIFSYLFTNFFLFRNKLMILDIILSVLLFLWGFGGMVFQQILQIKL